MMSKNLCLLILLTNTIIISLCSSDIINEKIETNELNENYQNLINSPYIKSLNDTNFEEEILKQKCGLVAFTVPWCEHCNNLHPNFVEAAEILKDEDFKLFHINPEQNTNTSVKYDILSYPTLKYILNKTLIEYESSKNSPREIASIMKKICGNFVLKYDSLLTIFEDTNRYRRTAIVFADEKDPSYNSQKLNESLEKISASHKDILFGVCLLNNLHCNPSVYESIEFIETADIYSNDFQSFIVYINSDLQKYEFLNEGKPPKKNGFSFIYFFSKETNDTDIFSNNLENLEISEEINFDEKLNSFVNSYGYDVLNKLEDRTAEIAFNQGVASLFFFRNSTSKFIQYDEVFKKAAEILRGKILFFTFSLDNGIEEKLADLLFVDNDDMPQIRIIYTLNEDEIRTYLLPFNFTDPENQEKLNEDLIINFYKDFTENKLEPYYKSEPIPDKNINSTIKKIVGSTFNDLVYDTNKFRIIKIYLPWDIMCKQLKPTYEKLADKFYNYTDLVFTELDFSKNEVPNNFVRAYPMIFFWKKGETKLITYMGDRTFESMEDFILINMGLEPINNYNDNEEEAPTVPAGDFFRVNKEDIPDSHDIPDDDDYKQDL